MQKQLPRRLMDTIRLDWKNPRLICIVEKFSQNDIDIVEIVPLRIELFKFRLYDGDLLSLDALTLGRGGCQQFVCGYPQYLPGIAKQYGKTCCTVAQIPSNPTSSV